MNTNVNEDESNNCTEIVAQHQNLLLSDKEKAMVVNKIFQYYSFIGKKKTTCFFCKASTSSNKPKSIYNPTTGCRTLRINCIHSSKPCSGWTYTYGVIFNVYQTVKDIQSKINEIKINITMNKNNVMYGYIDIPESIKIHNAYVEEIESLTASYVSKLYNLLYYTENPQIQKDMSNFQIEIASQINAIRQYTIQGNYQEVVEAYNSIKQLYKCINKLKQYIQSVYSEQLIYCNSTDISQSESLAISNKVSSISKDKAVKPKQKKIPKEKSVISKKKKVTIPVSLPLQISEIQVHPENHAKIESILGSVRELLKDDKIYEIIKEEPEAVDDLETYMNLLSKEISHGTELQKREYAEMETQYTKFKNNTQTAAKLDAIEL